MITFTQIFVWQIFWFINTFFTTEGTFLAKYTSTILFSLVTVTQILFYSQNYILFFLVKHLEETYLLKCKPETIPEGRCNHG